MLANLFKNQKMLLHCQAGGESCLKQATPKTMKQLKLLLLLILTGVFYSAELRAQTASVTANPAVICDGEQPVLRGVVAALPSGVVPTKFEFFINGTSASVINSSNATVDYPSFPLTGGVYTTKVVVTLSNSATVTSPDVSFNVYFRPIPIPSLASVGVQCFRGNNFCFLNSSIQNPSTPSNPLSSFVWNWGDAQGDSTFNTGIICHKYNAPGTYNVFLRAVDDRGCRKDTVITNALTVNQNITPDFDWQDSTGPCFKSCYWFTNLSPVTHDKTLRYEWDFGDGTAKVSANAPYSQVNNQNPPSQYIGSTPFGTDSSRFYRVYHCYTRNGVFSPKLTLVDLTNCTDSLRKTQANSQKPLPSNITFEFDITTYKGDSTTGTHADTVCVQSMSATEICFRMTPITLAAPGSGDFVWDFGDPNNPQPTNLDSNAWSVCHAYSSMGAFFPSITIKNICGPGFDTTFYYHSAVTPSFRFDSLLLPYGTAPADNDWGPNTPPGPPIPTQVVPYAFGNPIFVDDSIMLYRNPSYKGFFKELNDSLYEYKTKDSLRVMMTKVINGITLPDSAKVPETFILTFRKSSAQSSRKIIHTGDTVYSYVGRYPRPVFWLPDGPIIKDVNGVKNDSFGIYTPMMNNVTTQTGYGVEVTGPFARIENSPAQITLKGWQKNQCGPSYTVDFVNTSLYWKSRKIWRRWDFDDDYAPICTSFSRPKAGFPPAAGWGPHPNGAVMQERNSDHFYIYNGKTYPGRVNCKWSHDTLPRHTYTNWDTVFSYYQNGKDWLADANSSSPMYWDPVANRLSTAPGITNGQAWARVDTFGQAFWPTTINPGDPINIRRVPDPWSINRGDNPYVILDGGTIRPSTSITYTYNGNTYTVNGSDIVPGTFMTFYHYVFTRVTQRCLTVRLKLQDTLNHESGHPQRAQGLDQPPPGHSLVDDSLALDNFDCNGESTVQLALGKSSPYGLGKRGKECPGDLGTGKGAFVEFSLAGTGSYPGVVPNCGQTHILFNVDSIADRKDNTPCVIDGWTGFNGGVTPGGLIRPTFNTCPNARPIPPCPWTSPGGTRAIWHFGFNAGPNSAFNFPPPADTLGGWITVGIQIGCGCKTKRDSVAINLFQANPNNYKGSQKVLSTDPWVVGMPANPPGPPTSPLTLAGNPQFVVYNYAYTDTIARNSANTHYYIDYVDCNHANSKTQEVWYHNFVRIMNLDAQFDVSPTALFTAPILAGNGQPLTCRLRGKGDEITAIYLDSIMDSIAYSAWEWGDGTVTVDSFKYYPTPITDGYFVNGMRRVRYNIDKLLSIVIDSTVFPIRASGIGATDGLQPRTPGYFVQVPYDVTDYCTGLPKANPQFYIADTAMMFLPVKHKFVRSSWEATGSNDLSTRTLVQHVIASTKECLQDYNIPVVIGIVDTFKIYNGKNEPDTIFCENEEVFFRDSVHYWRYDCSLSDPTNGNPNLTMSRYLATVPVVVGTPPFDGMHIDTADFWEHSGLFNPHFKGTFFTDTMYRYDENGVGRDLSFLPAPPWQVFQPSYKYKLTVRVDSIFNERIFWDFGDGTPIVQGVNPSHKYGSYGRFTVTMYTIDSLGFRDTCVRWLNIVRPFASQEFTKKIFNCTEIFNVMDSSYLAPGVGTLDNIIHNFWWFGENKVDTITPQGYDIFKPKKASWPYRSYGEFTVKLKVTTEQGCSDSAYQTIYVKGPRPRFELMSDTLGCAPLKIRIWNQADSIGMQDPADTPTRETIIYWGDPGSSPTSVLGRRDTVEHTYVDSGVFSILAVGRDAVFPNSTLCLPSIFPDTATDPLTGALLNKPIKIYVKKYRNILSPNDTTICVGNPVRFDNTSDNAFTKFTYSRLRGDSIFLDSIQHTIPAPDNVQFNFDSIGRFSVQSIPRGFDPNQIPLGAEANCIVRDTSWVTVVKPTPKFDTVRVDQNSAKFTMVNTTNVPVQNSDVFEWTMYNMDGSVYVPKDGEIKGGANPKTGNLSDPDFEFDLKNDTGSFKICLKAWHISPPSDCVDTVCRVITNLFITRIKIPNVYTPNGDGSNDNFMIDIEGEDKYDLQIFNRWGNKVFESRDKTKTWNGKDMNDGGECPAGVYYFIFNYQLRAQDPTSVTGTVTLIR